MVVNHRGCAGTHLATPLTYSAAGTNDLDECIHYIAQAIAGKGLDIPMFAVGFSMGANVLMKYLGEREECTPFRAAISVHNSYNFILCSQSIERQLFGLYDKVLAKSLKKKVDKNKEALQGIE